MTSNGKSEFSTLPCRGKIFFASGKNQNPEEEAKRIKDPNGENRINLGIFLAKFTY
jgi:hypothetical protein